MIRKEEKLVITFFTTTDAMAMEAACKRLQAEGRLIPVPRQISAGCGLAWCVQPKKEEEMLNILTECQIKYQEFHICMV